MCVFSRASRVHIRLCISFAQSWPPPTPPPGGYCMHFLSECIWHLTILCFSNSNCLAPCLATMLQHQQLCYQHHTANALLFNSQFSQDSAAPLDQKNFLWKCRSGQNCLHCMHAHTRTILWQAPYQSFLSGV